MEQKKTSAKHKKEKEKQVHQQEELFEENGVQENK
jgi:dolichyl-diphosphooligosaccharide--protein glycosyltransferase